MLEAEIAAFARANLPPPPARVLEVGAGEGELARALASWGYDVVAIDPEPRGERVAAVALGDLDEPAGSFDAAVAVLSLHHVHPLEASCERLADALRPGAPLLVDEFDVAALDARAAGWWLEQSRRLGRGHDVTVEELLESHRSHLHPLDRVVAALGRRFAVSTPIRGAYLYRWELDPSLRPVEEELIGAAELPALGARLLAFRRPR